MPQTPLMTTPRSARGLRALAATTLTLLAAACTTPPSPPPAAPSAPPSTPTAPPAPAAAAPAGVAASQARSPREYRRDAAAHLYRLNTDRIYIGRLPPMLYAIGTVQVEVDRRGQVQGIHWMRAPTHAPEVVAEIERTIRAAAPFPVPERLGKVTYTDTWLWHKSGRFQLDTLTEGQD
jgi:protein TonB